MSGCQGIRMTVGSKDTCMDKAIEIVPALKRVELQHVGCWEELCMEFLPGLNIITDDYRGTGKSTILRAIVKAVRPSIRMEYSVSPTRGYPEGHIFVELMSPNITHRITDSLSLPLARASNEPQGNFSLKLLRYYIEGATPSTAIIVEDEVTAVLDDHTYAEAVILLNASLCQVVCIISHRLNPNQFRQARIYACYWDKEDDKARIRLQQSGLADC